MAARTGHGNTPRRSIRIPDDVWNAAVTEANRRGESVSEAVVTFLRAYADRETPQPSGPRHR